jgi:hypothetical protein
VCRRLACVALVVLIAGCAVRSDASWRKRAYVQELDDELIVEEIDMGVVLDVVEVDPTKPLIPGEAPPLRVIRSHERGGLVAISYQDGIANAQWAGMTRNPVQWTCSVDQEPLILHGEDLPLWLLIQGSEGSGKTTIIPQWVAFRAFEHIGTDREIGITAPTNKRMAHIKRAIAQHWPASWYRYVDDTKLYTFHAGPRVQLVSAHQQSEAEGSPIQGFNWVAAAGDELQDHHDKDADIIARGRSAPGARYKRINTSTFKDSPDWRDFRGKVENNDRWRLTKLLGLQSPFIHPDHWESMRKGLTPREFRRRVLALDVGPEKQVYYQWARAEADLLDPFGEPVKRDGKTVKRMASVRPLPIGAVDVTRREMSKFGTPNTALLIGHDPGKRQHVSEFLKAYEFPERRLDENGRPLPPLVRWFVVDEVTTPESTIESHIAAVLTRAQARWKVNLLDYSGQRPAPSGASALVRIDPHTESGTEHPDRTVYSQWRNAGFHTMAAAYNPKTQKPTPIKVDARVDLLNTLLCNTDGDVRLLVLCDDQGNPAAKELVKSFESMECDAAGNAEWEKKDGRDRSHWPCAVAFALWAIEKPRVDALRARAA